MKKTRTASGFSLAFLDVMSCGFGAVVLIFLIINHNISNEQEAINQDLLAELRLLDYEVLEGKKDLSKLIEQKDQNAKKLEQSKSEQDRLELELSKEIAKLSDMEKLTIAKKEDIARLFSDIDTRQDQVAKLEAEKSSIEGTQIRTFEGDGDRQYLTGMKVGGRNIVIAIDVSASMLDETILNVLRRRNMSSEQKKSSPKWRRAIATVDWLATQLPLDADFQVFTFNQQVRSLVGDPSLDWHKMEDGEPLNEAIEKLDSFIPEGGTNLEALMTRLQNLSPIPDNIYIITDGLPTRNSSEPRSATVSGKQRLDYFREAASKISRQIPINVVLFPMEGDPMASAAWWQLARLSGGAFISPSWDWP